jgi:hypothetical protein
MSWAAWARVLQGREFRKELLRSWAQFDFEAFPRPADGLTIQFTEDEWPVLILVLNRSSFAAQRCIAAYALHGRQISASVKSAKRPKSPAGKASGSPKARMAT